MKNNSLLKLSAALGVLLLTGGTVLFAGDISGKVTDSKGKPMAGIPVSDGISIVKSAEDGSYKLNLRDGQPFVFIQNPDGYYAEDWFHRKPQSGKKYDFVLEARKKPSPRFFLQFADSEIEKMGWEKPFRKTQADFIVHTGDIAGEKASKAHVKHLNFKTHGVPVYYVIGNHDVPDPRINEDKEYYEKFVQPYYYSFCWDKYLMIVAPMWKGDGPLTYKMRDFGDWLAKLLAAVPDKQVIMLAHDLYHGDLDLASFPASRGKMIGLQGRDVAWVTGHHHSNTVTRMRSGAKYFCVAPPFKGGIDHSFSATREVRINDKGELESELLWGCNRRALFLTLPNNGLALEKNGKTLISATGWGQVSPIVEVKAKIGDAEPVALKQIGGSWQLEVDAKDIENKNIELIGKRRDGAGMRRLYKPENRKNNTSIKLSWMSNMESDTFATAPLVVDGKVITTATDCHNDTKSGVYAWDAATGKLLWKQTECGQVPGQIAYANGVLYFITTGHHVYAISADNGKVIWKDIHPATIYNKPSGILLADGVFYAGARERFTAYDAATGKVIWRARGWKRGGAAGLNRISKVGNTLIVTYNWHGVMGFDAATGKMKWFTKDRQIRFASSGALIYNGKVYMKGGRDIIVLDPETGKVLKRVDLKISTQSMSEMVPVDGSLVFGNRDWVISLDPETLETRWKVGKFGAALVDSVGYARNAKSVESTVVLWKGKLWFGANDGYLYALDPQTGKTLERYNIGAPIIARMTPDGDNIYMVDFVGRVYCFTAK